MTDLNIPSDLRKKKFEEEKVIIQAAGASKGGNNSLAEMIAQLVEQKFEDCKNDPDQFNAPYAYAKTRHMLDRHNYLLTLSQSEQDLEMEMKRITRLTTVDPTVLMSQYFGMTDTRDRFSWAGRLASVESTLMYDIMQIMALLPGATLQEYNEKMADPDTAKLLTGLQELYSENRQGMPPNRQSSEREKHPRSGATSSSGSGCMLVVIAVSFIVYFALSFFR